MSTEIAIQANNLGKCYPIYDKPRDRLKQAIWRGRKQFFREFWALRDLSFTVKKGEAIGVIGRNGAGKSTLLQLLSKTLTPTTGTLEVKGRVAALLELGAGFNLEFTGRENIYMNGAILGLSHDEITEKFDEIVAFADIGEFIEQPVKTYSSGMFVRLAFSVQACVDPDILIVDEALAVGDVFFRQRCYQRLRSLLERGTAVLLVTHSMGDVEEFCDRVVVLDRGRSVFQGDTAEAIKHYYLVHQESAQPVRESLKKPAERRQIKKVDSTLHWPAADAFIDMSNVPQVSQGLAHCTAIAICNSEGQPQNIFKQGETASFFYEFELLGDISVPIGGILIQNEKGVVIHGKHTLQNGTQVPNAIARGSRVYFRQDIVLNLGLGEYTVEVGLSTIKEKDYVKRMFLSNADLEECVMRLCHVPRAASFLIVMGKHGEYGQVPFHGMVDLPGNIQMSL